MKESGGQQKWGNLKESPGNNIEVVRVCDALNCWECQCHAWVCGGGVCCLAVWVCLGETHECVHVSVACLDVLRTVMFRLGASYFLPVMFARCASPSQ